MSLSIQEARTGGKNVNATKGPTINGISEHPAEVTGLLLEWGQGDEAALARLIPLVHEELQQIARRYMAGEAQGHSLQATALVNEAYLRLVDAQAVPWRDRNHFMAVAARAMRRILVDHARARRYQKRGGDAVRVTFDEALLVRPVFRCRWPCFNI